MRLLFITLMAFLVVPSPSPTPKWSLTGTVVNFTPFALQKDAVTFLWVDKVGNIHGSGALFAKQMTHFRAMCLGVIESVRPLQIDRLRIDVSHGFPELECDMHDDQGNSYQQMFIEISRKDLVI